MSPLTDQVFKALADPTRRRLLDRLFACNGQTSGQLCEQMGMSRQAVAQHLEVLESANLVSAVWRGREKHHFLNPVPIHGIYDRWVRKFDGGGCQSRAQKMEHVFTTTTSVPLVEAAPILVHNTDAAAVAAHNRGKSHCTERGFP